MVRLKPFVFIWLNSLVFQEEARTFRQSLESPRCSTKLIHIGNLHKPRCLDLYFNILPDSFVCTRSSCVVTEQVVAGSMCRVSSFVQLLLDRAL